jgi:uncharacterized lipoprotein YddW (UPF0748 family)
MASTVALAAATYEPATLSPPKPQREFRGAWVATVKNIDWPSKPGLSTAAQKAELLAILDRAEQLKLNAIIFQVRPMCDALYSSAIEPWSQFLTGRMGKAPEPFYDPLEFAVAEAHKRGLELHAWFNPYRALVKTPDSPPSGNHVSKSRPELVRDYGKHLWLDPGEKAVQEYSLRVVLDVVKRYDVDGVHFDDYFYPYTEKVAGIKELDFPDDASWKKYGAGSGLSRGDWRRENVNTFVQRAYKSIKAAKPWVKFGVSPFGIWRPEYPQQIKGYDAYAKLYADSRKWLVNGWLDYLAPQLYWRIEPPQTSFPVLLKWWAEQNKLNRHVWAGMNTANTAKDGAGWPAEEIVRQIETTRRQSGVSGHVHWNAHSLLQNQSLVGNLGKGVYAQPALVPACAWLGKTSLSKPSVFVSGLKSGDLRVAADARSGEVVQHWVLQTEAGGQWKTEILPRGALRRTFGDVHPDAISVTPIDRYGNAGPSMAFKKKQSRKSE